MAKRMSAREALQRAGVNLGTRRGGMKKKGPFPVATYLDYAERFLNHMAHFPHFTQEWGLIADMRLALQRTHQLQSASRKEVQEWLEKRIGELQRLLAHLERHKEGLDQVREEEHILEEEAPLAVRGLARTLKEIGSYFHIMYSTLNKLIRSVNAYITIFHELIAEQVSGLLLETELGQLEKKKLTHHFHSNDWQRDKIAEAIRLEEQELQTVLDKIKEARSKLILTRGRITRLGQ